MTTTITPQFRDYMYGYMSWPPEDEHTGTPKRLLEILSIPNDERRLPVNNREPRELMSKQKYALIRERDGSGCRYCYAGGTIEIDHIIPRSVFPAEHLHIADRSDNLQVSCRDCNQRKSNYDYGSVKRPGVTPACWECLNPAPEDDEIALEPWMEAAGQNRNHLVFCGRCGMGGFVPDMGWVL